MTKLVIGPEVALHLARHRMDVDPGHQLLAPTLIRSQVLSLLYRAVKNGELTRADADRQLEHVRGLRLRLLGDRVLQATAWKVADQLGWSDTLDAGYVALTQLQADALVTLDPRLAREVTHLVRVEDVHVLAQGGAWPRARPGG